MKAKNIELVPLVDHGPFKDQFIFHIHLMMLFDEVPQHGINEKVVTNEINVVPLVERPVKITERNTSGNHTPHIM